MARYKSDDLHQGKCIPLALSDQILPGSLEHTLNELMEKPLNLSICEQRYGNDQTGRLASDPAVLLQLVLHGSYKGMVSSRRLEETCRRSVVCMALSADTRSRCTTLAACVSPKEPEIIALFGDGRLYCDALGLIGKEHVAMDGCKLPSATRSASALDLRTVSLTRPSTQTQTARQTNACRSQPPPPFPPQRRRLQRSQTAVCRVQPHPRGQYRSISHE